ncbi:MAG: hypothetical protein PVF43_16090 [Candidatus Eiseniibacteriota bacterium]|jgi:hypothetical protein
MALRSHHGNRAALPPALLSLALLAASVLVLALLVAGCGDEDDDGDGGATGVPVNDIARFQGAWVIYRTGADVGYLLCGEANDPCRQQVDRVLDAYFQLPVVDSTCVRIDSLRHLILIDPFLTSGTVTGNASGSQAAVECEHPIVIEGDTLITSVEIDHFLDTAEGTLFADVTVRVQGPGGEDCGACAALFGLNGVRQESGACGP